MSLSSVFMGYFDAHMCIVVTICQLPSFPHPSSNVFVPRAKPFIGFPAKIEIFYSDESVEEIFQVLISIQTFGVHL